MSVRTLRAWLRRGEPRRCAISRGCVNQRALIPLGGRLWRPNKATGYHRRMALISLIDHIFWLTQNDTLDGWCAFHEAGVGGGKSIRKRP